MTRGLGGNFARIILMMLALLAWGVAPAQTTLYEDAFAGSDGQRPNRWRILGATTPDFWFIDDGKLNTGDGNNYPIGASYAIVEAPGSLSWADYTVSAMVTPMDEDRGGRIMLVARYVDPNNFYFASLTSIAAEGGQATQRQVELVRFSGGTEQELGVVTSARGANIPAIETPNSGPYDFRLTVKGTQLTVSLNGVDVLTADDPTFPKGSAGVGEHFSHALFDDFRIGANTAGASATPIVASSNQGTPRTTGSGGDWRIAIIEGMTRPDAERRARELEDGRIPDVTFVPNEEGAYTVYVGRYKSEDDAITASNVYQNEGLTVAGVQFVVEPSSPLVNATSGTRVRVDSFPAKEAADQLKAKMGLEGFYPVEVIERSGQYAVFAGPYYTQRTPAERLVATLREKGYLKSAPEDDVPVSTAASTFQTNPVTAQQIADAAKATGKQLSDAQVQDLQKLVELQASGAASGDIATAQAEIARRDEATRQLLSQITLQVEESRRREERATAAIKEFQLMLNQRRIPEAERALADLKAADPGNPSILLMVTNLDQLRTASESNPAEIAKKSADEARAAEARGDLNAAIAAWEQARRTQSSGALYEEATREVGRLKGLVNAPVAAPPSSGGSGKIVIIVGIIAVLVVLGAIGFFLYTLKQRTADRQALAAMHARGTTPLPVGVRPNTPGGLQGGPMTNTPLPTGGPVFAPEPTPMTARNFVTPVPVAQAHLHTQDDDSGSLNIPGVMQGGAAPITPQSIPLESHERIRPGATLSPQGSAAPVTPFPPAPSSGSVRRPDMGDGIPDSGAFDQQSTEMRLPSSTNIPLHPISSSGSIHVRGAFPPGVFFEQNFEDEKIGEVPRGWKGKYDYSTLEVVGGGAYDDAGRSMRFDKRNGAGSAYYSLKFPDASGKIGLEFDIRCDDKNRYLIGFYIEKDEDFRQAISTIVHRTNQAAPPTLRLQNEQTPYEFKKWVHVKYIIDLPRSLVDGWVDEVPVASGVKLTQAPKVLNTLSIRDNSQTVGILMVDNIRIYRA